MSDAPHSPRLGFGCVRLGSASAGTSWRSDVRLVQEAIDLGVVVFDTANAYGNGVSEIVLGRGVRGRRDAVLIATKAGYQFEPRTLARQSLMRAARPALTWARQRRGGANGRDESAPGGGGASYTQQDFSPDALRRAVEASLRRLDTDHVDVLQLHGPPRVMEAVVPVADELVASGKILRFGVGAESVGSAEDWLAVDRVDVVQLPFGMLDPEAAARALPLARERGVEVWARGVFAGGILAAATRGDPDVAKHPKIELIRQLQQVAYGAGISLFQLGVDYVRSNRDVSTILLGIHSSSHLADNLRMMRTSLVDRSVVEDAHATITRWVENNESS